MVKFLLDTYNFTKFAMSGLDEAIDLIPTNKILAFGGDYSMPVEKCMVI